MELDELERSRLYSEELGIDLSTGDDGELFEWFLASVLFGARISEDIAKRTYRAFERHDCLTPRRIVDAGFDFLVNPIMREGGYVRYDNQRSDQIIRNCETLLSRYDGRLSRLHEEATSSDDLEERLDSLYRVGPVTVNVFLRELRPFWEKSDPEPLPVVAEVAARYGVDLDRYDRKSLTFARVEAGLIRARHA